MLTFTCTHCSRPFKATDAYAGKRIKCPSCGKVVLIPKSSENTPVAPPAQEAKPAISCLSFRPGGFRRDMEVMKLPIAGVIDVYLGRECLSLDVQIEWKDLTAQAMTFKILRSLNAHGHNIIDSRPDVDRVSEFIEKLKKHGYSRASDTLNDLLRKSLRKKSGLVCDVCLKSTARTKRNEFEPKDVITKQDYWKFVLQNQWDYYHSLDPEGMSLTVAVEQIRAQAGKWLLCDECMARLDLDSVEGAAEANTAAHRFQFPPEFSECAAACGRAWKELHGSWPSGIAKFQYYWICQACSCKNDLTEFDLANSTRLVDSLILICPKCAQSELVQSDRICKVNIEKQRGGGSKAEGVSSGPAGPIERIFQWIFLILFCLAVLALWNWLT